LFALATRPCAEAILIIRPTFSTSCPDRGLHAVKDSREIEREHRIPLRVRELFDGRNILDPRVVHQNVEAAQLFLGPLYDRRDPLGLPQVSPS